MHSLNMMTRPGLRGNEWRRRRRALRNRRAMIALTAACLALLGTSCGEEEGTASDARATPVVDDRGAQPRRALKLDVADGDEGVVNLEMHVSAGGVPEPTRIRTEIRYTVDDVTSDEIATSFEYGPFRASDPAVELRLQGMEGLRGRQTSTLTGELIDASIDAPASLDPAVRPILDELERQFGSIVTPFPDRPVGVGAEWSARTEVETSGIRMEQRTTYTLEDLDGERYVLSVDVEGSVQPGEIDDPSLGDAEAEVTGGEIRGSGRIEGSLSSIFPLRSTGSIQARQEIEVTEGGRTERLDVATDLKVKVELAR